MPEHTPTPTPSRAVYGFAMYLCFRMFFILYLIWAVIPEPWFEYFGITCLPQRYWAVAIPVYIITAVLIFALVIYPSINLCMTPAFNDMRTIMDEMLEQRTTYKELYVLDEYTCNNCICANKAKCGRLRYLETSIDFQDKCIPAAEDLDITEVSRHLYLKLKSS